MEPSTPVPTTVSKTSNAPIRNIAAQSPPPTLSAFTHRAKVPEHRTANPDPTGPPHLAPIMLTRSTSSALPTPSEVPPGPSASSNAV